MDNIIFGFFPLTAIMLIALTLLDDIPIMAIAYDNTGPDPQPARWNKNRVFTTSLTLVFLAVVQSFALLYYGMEYLHLDAAHLRHGSNRPLLKVTLFCEIHCSFICLGHLSVTLI